MLRNREFRQIAILFSLIAAVAVTLGFAVNRLAGILAIASATAFGTAFFAFTKARYKRIAQISDQIDLVLHNADRLYIGELDEGELSILQSEITKMTLRIREQNDALKKEKLKREEKDKLERKKNRTKKMKKRYQHFDEEDDYDQY